MRFLFAFYVFGIGIANATTSTLTFTNPTNQYINVTNQAGLSFSGDCSNNGAQITVDISGQGSQSAVCGATIPSKWSVTNVDASSWPQGSVTLKAYYNNEPGTVATKSLTKDTKVPFVSISNPPNGFIITDRNQSSVRISGSCYLLQGETLNKVQIEISDTLQTNTIDVDCVFQGYDANLDLSHYNDGTINFNVKATTSAGNFSTASSSYLKDTVPVTIHITNAPTAINIANQAVLNLSGDCSSKDGPVFLNVLKSNNTVLQSLTETCDSSKKWTVTNLSLSSVADGPITFRIQHLNLTTQISSDPVILTLNKDTVAPVLSFDASLRNYKMNATTSDKLTVSGKCTFGDLPVDIGTLDASSVFTKKQSVTCDAAGTFSAANIDFSSFSDGVINLAIVQLDAAGNRSEQDLSFTKKMTLPTLTLTSNAPASGYINMDLQTTFALSGSCSEFGNNGEPVIVNSVPALPSQPLSAVCNNGVWTLKITVASLPEGAVTFSAFTTDFVGNISSTKTLTLTKDVTPPVVTLTAPIANYKMNATTGSKLDIKGTCTKGDPGVTIGTTKGGVFTKISTTPCSGSGTFSLTNNDFRTFADGTITLTVSQRDLAGNKSSQDRSFTKKMTLPTLTLTSNAPASGYINMDLQTTFVLSGSCSEFGDNGEPVIVNSVPALPSQPLSAVCNNGVWTLPITVASLPDGAVTFSAFTTDFVGNISSTKTLTLTKDVTPPVVTLTAPIANYKMNATTGPKLDIKGTCTKGDPAVTIGTTKGGVFTRISTTPCLASGTFSLTNNDFSTFADGTITLIVSQEDLAGNKSSQDRSFTKKMTLPTLTLTSNAPASGYINMDLQTTFVLSGSCSEFGNNGEPVIVNSVPAHPSQPLSAVCNNGVWTLNYTVASLPDGAVTFSAFTTDFVGNISSTKTLTLTKDVTPPVLTVIAPVRGFIINKVNYKAVNFNGTCAATVNITGAVQRTLTCTSGNWSMVLDTTSIADGNLTFNFASTDTAGNTATQSLVLKKDIVSAVINKPPLNLRILAQDKSNTLTWDVSNGALSYGIYRSSVSGGGYTKVGSSTSLSYTDSSLTNGTLYYYVVRSVGSDGAESSNSLEVAGRPNVYMLNKISTGFFKACAIDNTGVAKCWGGNQASPWPVSGGDIFVSISAGDNHTCGITSSGQAKCWGWNAYGQLGDGTRTDRSTPVLVSGGDSFASISVGSEYTCGITSSGQAKCWGWNIDGELGDGTRNDRSTPVLVSGGDIFVSISAGSVHTCGITTSGQAKCWGSNNYRQLGDGTRTDRSTPVLVSGGDSFASIIAGDNHTCGITTSGQAKCWGQGFPRPWPVSGGDSFASISAGDNHTCGITTSGQAKCLGRNSYGQLGDGTTTDRSTPVLVSGGDSFASISAGGDYTCGITTSGQAKCWGYNQMGALGDGTRSNQSTPVLVSGGDSYASISINDDHTCGITTSGQAMCWGPGVPWPVKVSVGDSYASISMGDDHTCGITTSGQAKCWGWNGAGQLGDGTRTYRSTPVLVSGGDIFVSISAGNSHTCGITTSGQAKCWGWNRDGVLGDGTRTDRSTPVLVSGGDSFTSISAGGDHTCGITTSGQAKCWGWNWDGQLGDGTKTDRSTPVLVSGGDSFVSISAGSEYTCGITTSGQAKCWGWSRDGVLGDGTTTDRSTPVLVSGGDIFVSISAGNSHTCGITTSGQAKCWGWNIESQLGDGTTTSRSTPVLVSGGDSFASISTGKFRLHTCGITTSGQAKCWGSNWDGQLGNGHPTTIPRLVNNF